MMRAGIGLVAAAMVAHAAAAHAAPLEKEECAKLKGEQAQLEQSGVRSSMGRGPEWAKANLSSERLEQVRRVIELDEQLLFRCQGKPLVTLRAAQRGPCQACRAGSRGRGGRQECGASQGSEGQAQAQDPRQQFGRLDHESLRRHAGARQEVNPAALAGCARLV